MAGFANVADETLQLVQPKTQYQPQPDVHSNFNTTPQNSNIQDLVNANNKILPTFLSTFINQEFITDLVNVLLYQSDFSSANSTIKSSDIVRFINTFITDVNKQITRAPNSTFQLPKKVLLSATNLAREVLQLRENITGKLINYDNVIRHFPKHEMVVGKILNDVVNNQITNHDDFRTKFDITVQSIQAFNEVIEISTTLVNWDTFINEATRDDTSSFALLKAYRDLISQSYNELSQLTTLQKQEELDDYIVLHDQHSTKKVVDNLVQFLSSGYNFFKTGYSLLDDNVDGMESATFHLITGPSNHAKSIFMINICKNLLLCNQRDYEKGDVIVYVTLEDDLNKVLRRFISIFGNVDSKITKQLFIVASTMFKSVSESADKSTVSNMIEKLLTDVINKSIIKHTSNGNCKIIIKHSAENSFSPADATRFIDSLRLQGHNCRALFVDYIDVELTSVPQQKCC